MPRSGPRLYARVAVSVPKHAYCPHCGQRAPIRLRGIDASCTACGHRRMPFAAPTLNLAGTGYRVGGIAAKAFSAVTLVMGTAFTLFLFFLASWLFPGSALIYALSLPPLLITLVLAFSAWFAGRKLNAEGVSKLAATQKDAIVALANHRGGVVSALEVAQTLEVSEAVADGMLTAMAKDPDGHVTLDLDDDGRVHYLFGVGPDDLRNARWRVAAPPVAAPPVEGDLHGHSAESLAEAEAELEAELAGRPTKTTRR